MLINKIYRTYYQCWLSVSYVWLFAKLKDYLQLKNISNNYLCTSILNRKRSCCLWKARWIRKEQLLLHNKLLSIESYIIRLLTFNMLGVQPPHAWCSASAPHVRGVNTLGGWWLVGCWWWLLGVEEHWYETYKVVKNNTYL